ncbi:MAG TPA: hypothetical protein VF748_15560 [Candidatus Acidoferrum sp.]
MSDTAFSGAIGGDVSGVGSSSGDFGGGGGLSTNAMLALGGGALAAGGLGYFMSQGPTQVSSIPGFAQANAMVPGLQAESAQTYAQGQGLIAGGQAGLAMAQRGELTPEQKAQLALTGNALENQAKQTYASMGRDMSKDTSGISTETNIQANLTAMAQNYIQSTIALAGTQLNAGGALLGTSLNESNAATNILLTEGAQQVALDKQYSDNLASAFKAIGTVVGGVAGAFVGGPAGAMAGATLGSKI